MYIHIDCFAQQRSTTASLQPSFIGKHRWPNIDPMNRGKRSVATIPVIRLNMYLRQFNSINLDVETAPPYLSSSTPPLSNLLSGEQIGRAIYASLFVPSAIIQTRRLRFYIFIAPLRKQTYASFDEFTPRLPLTTTTK